MGRAERRRAERNECIKNRKGKLIVSRQYLKVVRETVSRDNVKLLMTCFALAERRLYGYGHKRITRTLRCVDGMMGEICDGSKTIDDFINELKSETKVVINL